MNLNDYQKQALTTDFMDGNSSNVLEPSYMAKVLGLVGEAGEVAEKYKKILRDKDGVLTEADKTEIIKELGDVLWYIAVLAKYLGNDMEAVAQANIDKLQSRKVRGVQKGSGDNR